MYELERHMETMTRIQDALIESYQVDFPDAYEEYRSQSRDHMRNNWLGAYSQGLGEFLDRDLKEKTDRSLVSLYECAPTDRDRHLLLERVKEHVYSSYRRKSQPEEPVDTHFT